MEVPVSCRLSRQEADQGLGINTAETLAPVNVNRVGNATARHSAGSLGLARHRSGEANRRVAGADPEM